VKPILKILAQAKSLWPYYTVISIFSVLLAASNLLWPLFSGWLIDEIRLGASADTGRVVFLVSMVFLQDLGTTFFDNLAGYIGDMMTVRLRRTLSNKYFEHLLSLPQSYFDTELTGKIINRLSRSIDQVTEFIKAMSNNFLQFIFTAVFSLIFVALISWPTALMLATLYPIFLFMTVRTSNRWQNYQHDINIHRDIATGRFAEAIAQIKVVKSFIREKTELKFFDRHLRSANDISKPQSKLWHREDAKRRAILNVVFFAVYMFIFVQASKGTFTPGQAVTLFLLAFNIRFPIFTISFLVENTQKAVADSKDYFEVMDMKSTITDVEGAKKLNVKKGAVSFTNVEFSYSKEAVLRGLNFDIMPDTKVALVGESGEGKTTITNLLMRLYEPTAGTIKIDNQDITKVTQKSLRENIGVVFQDPALFSGTIRENIAYANPKASDATVVAAAKAANAHEFISKFEEKYDTQIGERGLKLSGGQKQRIAIARAILKDAPILILDEATSSLDNKSEILVQEALEHLMKGRTTIIIAHRLSTIQNVDTIITLQKGVVQEVGSPRR
jgi:ATP-binding cassette subfamily B protein